MNAAVAAGPVAASRRGQCGLCRLRLLRCCGSSCRGHRSCCCRCRSSCCCRLFNKRHGCQFVISLPHYMDLERVPNGRTGHTGRSVAPGTAGVLLHQAPGVPRAGRSGVRSVAPGTPDVRSHQARRAFGRTGHVGRSFAPGTPGVRLHDGCGWSP